MIDPHSTTTTPTAQWSQLLTEAVTKPGKMLEAYRSFWNYSSGNQLLALVQCGQRGITPGPLNTYPGWRQKGRQVRKGEKALILCQPLTYKNRDKQSDSDPDRFLRFTYRPKWFVLSQTDGDPVELSTPPEWQKARALAALNITETTFALTNGNTQGYASGRTIAVSPLAQLPHKTTFHELAHVMLGHTAEANFSDADLTPRDLREAEAESVALICCESLNLEGAEYCRGYIQNWLAGQPIPERSAQKIFHAADLIIRAGREQEVRADA